MRNPVVIFLIIFNFTYLPPQALMGAEQQSLKKEPIVLSSNERVPPEFYQNQIYPMLEGTHQKITQSLTSLLNEIGYQSFSPEGVGALQDYLQILAGQKAQFTLLRQVILETTEGQGLLVPVRVHEKEISKVEYINKMLRESAGIDFLTYKPVVDNSLQDPTQPLQQDRSNYNFWRVTRLGVMVSLGWLGIMVTQFGNEVVEGVATFNMDLVKEAIDLKVLGGLSLWAATVSILEAQFALFNNWWSANAWSKSYPLKIKPPQFSTEKSKMILGPLKQALNGLYWITKPAHKFVNTAAEKSKVLTQGLSYVYLVNITYQTLGFMTVNLGFWLMGMPMPNPDFVDLLAKGLLFSLAFDATVGLTQLVLGRQQRVGKLSETLRSKMEFIAILVGNAARFMAPIPQTQMIAVGIYTMLAAMTLTLPIGGLIREKLRWLKIRARFEENEKANEKEFTSRNYSLSSLGIPTRSGWFVPMEAKNRCSQIFNTSSPKASRMIDASITRLPDLFRRAWR